MPVGRPTPPRDDFVRMLKDFMRETRAELKALKTGRRLEAASIGRGGLTINGGFWRLVDSNGTLIGYVGGLENGAAGLLFYRTDGTPAFTINGAGAAQYIALMDRQGNIVVSDDTASGQGLSNPYLPLPHYPLRQPDPIVWTNSAEATWAALWNIPFLKQHPKVWVRCYATTESGTTGEVRLWDGFAGKQLGQTIPLAAFVGDYIDFGGPFPFDGGYQADSKIEVQARVTGGTGRIGTQVYYAYGQQT